jgi:pyruvate kinase
MTRNIRRTKIVCTLGPSSDSYEQIRALAVAGMDVARINFSHGTQKEHKKKIDIVRKLSGDLGKSIAVLQDLQGPKIRIKTFENGEIQLAEGDEFTLTTRDVVGNQHEVSVSYPTFNRDVRTGDTVLLDDGIMNLVVEKVSGTDVKCKVIFGGTLRDHKGLNLPGAILSVDVLTEKDKEDLEFGLAMDVDFVALSFVQKPGDVTELKKIIAKKGKKTQVIAKIEKPQAVENIKEIIDEANCIMIARGDLGVEMNTEEIPPIQKRIIAMCNSAGKPVITATQMLDSMIHNPRPTRAEASDIANAVLDGSDAVMLSGETASGLFPVESVETMERIVTLIEDKNIHRWDIRRKKPEIFYPTSIAIGYSACHAAEMVNAGVIVCLTQSGSTAEMIARFRPEVQIFAMTPKKQAYYRTALMWGVKGYLTSEFSDDMDEAIQHIIDLLLREDKIKKGDNVIFTAGIPFYTMRGSNMLRIETA